MITYPTNKLQKVLLSGGCEQRNLPAEYTQVEYLESTGTQYIDTGYKLSSADEVKVKAKFIDFLSSGYSYIFGIYGDNVNFGINSNNVSSYAVWSSSSTEFTPTMVRDTIYDVDIKLGLLTINGIAASYTPSETFTNTTKSAYLFWGNGTSQPKQPVAIYSFQIINNGTIIQNLIPAKRNSDNILGMYDTVTGNFLINAGTGSFTAGADVVPSPDTPMDIVCNNGVVKVNSIIGGKNAIDTSDIVAGYISPTTIGTPVIVTDSLASNTIKKAIRCEINKQYVFKYVSNIVGQRAVIIADDNGNALTSYEVLYCNIGLNEFTLTATATGWYWLGIQSGDLAIVQPEIYEIGQIYTDGIVETISAHGKNLYNSATSEEGKYLTDTGEIALDQSAILSDYIAVLPNTTYTYVGTRVGLGIFTRIEAFDANKSFVSLLVRDANVGTFSTSFNTGNAKYIRLSFNKTTANVQLELGSTATAYEPYFNGGTATAEMLLKVGDYKDKQEVLTGNVTRNIGIKVLTGQETWTALSGYTSLYYSDDAITGNKTGTGSSVWDIACSHFSATNDNMMSLNNTIRFQMTGSGATVISNRLYIKMTSSATSSDFTTFLATQYANGTPVIVIYPLAEPTTEQVTPQPLAGSSATVTAGSIDNLPIKSSTIADLKKRYIGDKEVQRVYIGDNLVWGE